MTKRTRNGGKVRDEETRRKFDEALKALDGKDYATVLAILSAPEFANDGEALNILGKIHLSKDERLDDPDKALDLFKKSAALGCPEGQCNLGMAILDNAFEHADFVKAKKLFQKSADADLPQGHYMLGFMLFEGMGGERDNIEALLHLLTAKKQGVNKADFFIRMAMKRELGLDDSTTNDDLFEEIALENPEAIMHGLLLQHNKPTDALRNLVDFLQEYEARMPEQSDESPGHETTKRETTKRETTERENREPERPEPELPTETSDTTAATDLEIKQLCEMLADLMFWSEELEDEDEDEDEYANERKLSSKPTKERARPKRRQSRPVDPENADKKDDEDVADDGETTMPTPDANVPDKPKRRRTRDKVQRPGLQADDATGRDAGSGGPARRNDLFGDLDGEESK